MNKLQINNIDNEIILKPTPLFEEPLKNYLLKEMRNFIVNQIDGIPDFKFIYKNIAITEMQENILKVSSITVNDIIIINLSSATEKNALNLFHLKIVSFKEHGYMFIEPIMKLRDLKIYLEKKTPF